MKGHRGKGQEMRGNTGLQFFVCLVRGNENDESDLFNSEEITERAIEKHNNYYIIYNG